MEHATGCLSCQASGRAVLDPDKDLVCLRQSALQNMAILRAARQILGMGNRNHGAIDTAMASDPALVWDVLHGVRGGTLRCGGFEGWDVLYGVLSGGWLAGCLVLF